MKTKNIFGAIFGIVFFLALASVVSAGIWFDFESDPSASSMTVPQGSSFNLVLTASSHNNVVVSSEKLEAIQGSNTYLLASWNEAGTTEARAKKKTIPKIAPNIFFVFIF